MKRLMNNGLFYNSDGDSSALCCSSAVRAHMAVRWARASRCSARAAPLRCATRRRRCRRSTGPTSPARALRRRSLASVSDMHQHRPWGADRRGDQQPRSRASARSSAIFVEVLHHSAEKLMCIELWHPPRGRRPQWRERTCTPVRRELSRSVRAMPFPCGLVRSQLGLALLLERAHAKEQLVEGSFGRAILHDLDTPLDALGHRLLGECFSIHFHRRSHKECGPHETVVLVLLSVLFALHGAF